MTVGLFTPLSGNYTTIYNVLSSIASVRLLGVGSKLGAIDIIVYPDGMGIMPNLPALTINGRAFVPSKPINPHFLQFTEENPIEVLEEKEIKLIGIGDAAAFLYSYIGGKVMLDENGDAKLFNHADPGLGLTPIENMTIFGKDNDLFIEGFMYESLAGVTNYTDLKKAVYAMRQKIKEEDDDLFGSQITPRGPVPPPMMGKESNNIN